MAPFFRGWLARIARAIAGLLPPPFIRYVPPPPEWESLLARYPELRKRLTEFQEMAPPEWETKRLFYTSWRWEEDPSLIVPEPYQKITARFLLIDAEGNTYVYEVSMPPGVPYDREYLLRALRATIMDEWEDELGRFLSPEERERAYDLVEKIVAEDYYVTEVEPRI